MEAIRIIKKPVKCEITIDLPESFGEPEVEVIVLPISKEVKNGLMTSTS